MTGPEQCLHLSAGSAGRYSGQDIERTLKSVSGAGHS